MSCRAASLERTILNAQMPGSWIDDPSGEEQEDGTPKKIFKRRHIARVQAAPH